MSRRDSRNSETSTAAASIAPSDATRGVDAGMNRFKKSPPDLSSTSYKPDWRGHCDAAQSTPAPRASLQLATPGRADELRRKFRPKAMVGG